MPRARLFLALICLYWSTTALSADENNHQEHASASSAEEKGHHDKASQLAFDVYERSDGDDASSIVDMVLTAKNGSQRVRRMVLFALDKGERERWSLMRFELPRDVEGTGLLTMDHPGDDTEQWLYLPALDRVRRVSSSRKGGRFVGSDFTYEDLRDREPEMDTHAIVGEDKIGKMPVTILESTPVERSNSIYSKRRLWIHEPTKLVLRVDFYERDPDKPSKRMTAARLKKIQGYWTVMNSTMEDLKSGSKTLLRTTAIKYDQGIPDELFSVRDLADASRQKPFIPEVK